MYDIGSYNAIPILVPLKLVANWVCFDVRSIGIGTDQGNVCSCRRVKRKADERHYTALIRFAQPQSETMLQDDDYVTGEPRQSLNRDIAKVA